MCATLPTWFFGISPRLQSAKGVRCYLVEVLAGIGGTASSPPRTSGPAVPTQEAGCCWLLAAAASLMHTYMGQAEADVAQRIQWNPDDPNMLKMQLPGELDVGAPCLACPLPCFFWVFLVSK
jgi:hypothetical protein